MTRVPRTVRMSGSMETSALGDMPQGTRAPESWVDPFCARETPSNARVERSFSRNARAGSATADSRGYHGGSLRPVKSSSKRYRNPVMRPSASLVKCTIAQLVRSTKSSPPAG